VGALGQAASPRLSKVYASGDARSFRGLFAKLLAIAACIGVVGVVVAAVAGRPILLVLYRPEYASANMVFTWVALATAISYVASIVGYTLTAAQVFVAQAPLFAGVSAATTAASGLLVPRFGLHGAAWALVIGNAVQLIGATTLLLLHFRRRGDQVGGRCR
jgi:O-antigen/teichoic acid export membrane protein